ncbi:sugar phosphate isomerase/epimerase family protein [Georgenia subflava]|uniref:TIM barrel protein n=1 Tax=Georgenia subflava TaxID=1622177 RepID=A0A6N7EEQ1_9MICO|nr:TIM barrel protein [Georgenia subflava]MPV35831.1 TIM barrel protein [Georgenia subflava]
MWTLAGFADDTAPDPETQFAVAAELGLRFVELSRFQGNDLLDLDDAQVRDLRGLLRRHNLRVSSIGTPVGALSLTQDLDRVRRAVRVAEALESTCVRIFSHLIPVPADAGKGRDEVLRRLTALAAVAASANLVLLHENRPGTYGDTPGRCLDVVESVGSEHLALAWDPAGFVESGSRPFTDGYDLLRPYLEYIHVRAARSDTGPVALTDRGEGQILETVRALWSDGFTGFFALSPHPGTTSGIAALTGPELATEAMKAVTEIADAVAVPLR